MACLRSTSRRRRKSKPSSDWPRWSGRTPPRTRATSPCRASSDRSLRTVTSETAIAFERNRAVDLDARAVRANMDRSVGSWDRRLGPVEGAQRRCDTRTREAGLGGRDPERVHDQIAGRRAAPAMAPRATGPGLRPRSCSFAEESRPVAARIGDKIGSSRFGQRIMDDVAKERLRFENLALDVPARRGPTVDDEAQATL